METLQTTINGLATIFQEKMAHFESRLDNASTSGGKTGGITEEFASFKTFITEALHNLQQQVVLLANMCERQEIRSRRKMLLLHGLPEKKQENISDTVTDLIEKKLKVTIDVLAISRCHRLGRPNTNKPRPTLIKFRDLALKNSVWFAKTALKGTGVTMSEFLTKDRHAVFTEARKRHGVSNCWTRDSRIFVVTPDGKRHQISTLTELETIPIQTGPPVGEVTSKEENRRTKTKAKPKK